MYVVCAPIGWIPTLLFLLSLLFIIPFTDPFDTDADGDDEDLVLDFFLVSFSKYDGWEEMYKRGEEEYTRDEEEYKRDEEEYKKEQGGRMKAPIILGLRKDVHPNTFAP
jgi:hypothetical protein